VPFLPLPYTGEALDLVCDNIARAQDVLGREMLIENPSTYIHFAHANMTEWQFLDGMCARTGCRLLLDINNLFVSANNHNFDPAAYLAGLPGDHVRQIHLAGHSQGQELLIDTHDCPDAMALSNRLIQAGIATSTMASGEMAKAMLAELRAGHGLIFRAAASTGAYGLPDSGMYRVGQYTKDGLKPIPIDASLETALGECGMGQQ
jgi:uncharacterized protein (UPF0276 family)